MDRHLILVYGVSGLMAGLAGIMNLAYFSTTTISGHPLDNLVVITAVVLGGASLFGGRGSMLGTFIGVFKIVFVDTSSSDSSLGVSRITSNNLGGGQLAASSLAQAIGGKGTVAVINVAPGISTTDARIQGFDQEMKAKYPNITVLPTQYDNDSSATASSQVSSDISAHPDLSGVFATNVLSAQGAATGVQHAGKSGKVKVATFDADPQQMQALKSNTIQLAIAQSPYLEGQDGVKQALNAANGKPVTASIGTPLTAITQANQNSATSQAAVYKSSC